MSEKKIERKKLHRRHYFEQRLLYYFMYSVLLLWNIRNPVKNGKRKIILESRENRQKTRKLSGDIQEESEDL